MFGNINNSCLCKCSNLLIFPFIVYNDKIYIVKILFLSEPRRYISNQQNMINLFNNDTIYVSVINNRYF